MNEPRPSWYPRLWRAGLGTVVVVVAISGVGLAAGPNATSAATNGVIAFGAAPPEGIYLADPSGAYFPVLDGFALVQDFSPDGNQILYLAGGGGTQSVRVVNVDGTGDHQIVPAGPIMSADWADDGPRVLYSTWVNGVGSSVYTIDPDGHNQQEIVGLTIGFDHTLSPDGTKIAYEGFILGPTEGCYGLVIADVVAPEPEMIYRGDCPVDLAGLNWSPDGSRIVFASWIENDPQPPWWDCSWNPTITDVFVVDFDGTDLTNLTNTSGVSGRYETHPRFSPDGTQIAFSSSGPWECVNGSILPKSSVTNLRIMNADGTGVTPPLTDFEVSFGAFGIYSAQGPAWQPCLAGVTTSCVVDPPGGSPTTTAPEDHTTTTVSEPPPTNPEPPPPGDSGTFLDDDGSVFEQDIEWLAGEGVTRGCNPPVNDRFCPDDPVTRGQMAAFLGRALGYNFGAGADLFVDDNDSIFEVDIDRLGTAGVTRGCNPPTNDRFCPADPVTRGQMAAFLVRAFGLTGVGENPFVDDDGSVFESDIALIAAAGVTRGCNPPTNDRFCPDDPVTRGQMAAFLRRAIDPG
jgi:hypothetical protein